MKLAAAICCTVAGAYGVDVYLPDYWLHIYFITLVGIAWGAKIFAQSHSVEDMFFVLLGSYVYENLDYLWGGTALHLLLLNLGVLGLIWAVFGHRRESHPFMWIYGLKAFAGALFLSSIISSQYIYHATLNVLGMTALVWFIYLSIDRGIAVRKGKLPDNRIETLIKDVMRRWTISLKGLSDSKQ